MSKGKHIKPNSEYLQEIIVLRNAGYSWTAIGAHLGKDRTTIMYIWKRWVGTPSRTTKTRYTVVDKTYKLLASWNGTEHVCCHSFLKIRHNDACPNVAGTWNYGDNFKDIPGVVKGKYDHLFDDKKNLGKSYQHYLLKK